MRTAALLILTLAVPAARAYSQVVVPAEKFNASGFSMAEVEAASLDPDWYTLDPKSIHIERIQDAEAQGSEEGSAPVQTPAQPAPAPAPAPAPSAPSYDSGLGEEDPFVIIDKIINLGEKIWAIIEKNKPVVNVQSTYANAVPQGITHWDQLEGWSEPKVRTYAFIAKNVYGAKMVEVRYQVMMSYGGNYKGKGKYITGVSIYPLLVEVGWGYKFSMENSVPSVSNVGTSENPVASLVANIKWTISTAVKESQGTSVYYMQGTGAMKEIGGPFKQAFHQDSARSLERARAADLGGMRMPFPAPAPVLIGR